MGLLIQTALSRYLTQILKAIVFSPEKLVEDAYVIFKWLGGGV